MGPNSINSFSSAASAAAMSASTPADSTQSAATANGLKINYGDSIKAERLQAGLQALQSARAKTELFIRSINPDIGQL